MSNGPSTGEGRGTTGAPAPARSGRRRWRPALLLALALLLPALYVLRSGGDGSPGRDGGVEVDLRDVGDRTFSLGRGIRPITLLQDDGTLWVQSTAAASRAELSKIDLASGEVLARVPFPESDIVGTITAGAGSLWVTTSSVESMAGEVVRIDPEDGEVITSIELPASPGRAVFTAGSLWVATVVQPAGAEIGASDTAISSAANALRRIDAETNELVASVELEATPLDVSVSDDLVLVRIGSADDTSVVAVDPATGNEVARIPVPEGAEPEDGADPDAAGPWMLFTADPYAVRVDVEAEAIAAVTGSRDGIDLVVPNGEHMWELRAEVLTVLDGQGDEVVTVTIDATPLAAAVAGQGAVWIAYQPSGDDEVLVTRVPAADLLDLSD